MKHKKNPTASQPSSVAELHFDIGSSGPWYFHDQTTYSWNQFSNGFKDREAAIKAALAAGFSCVTYEGKVIARRKE